MNVVYFTVSHEVAQLHFLWSSALCFFKNLRDGNFCGQSEQGYCEGHRRFFRWERSLSSLPTFFPQSPQWSTSPLFQQSVYKLSIFQKDLMQACFWFWCLWTFHALSAWYSHGNWHRKSPPWPGVTSSPTSASTLTSSPSPTSCSWWKGFISMQGWIKKPFTVFLG